MFNSVLLLADGLASPAPVFFHVDREEESLAMYCYAGDFLRVYAHREHPSLMSATTTRWPRLEGGYRARRLGTPKDRRVACMTGDITHNNYRFADIPNALAGSQGFGRGFLFCFPFVFSVGTRLGEIFKNRR
ncbi:hypothetical protein PG994_008521 [Apiospora phragmitis]|uniref:Uncharacterized protein n=1 Tax=Apiospora phragmitis TaxID=2905665 RepID=A0ABR1UGQ7_9PEZI